MAVQQEVCSFLSSLSWGSSLGSRENLPGTWSRAAQVSTAGACLNYELSALLVRDMVLDLLPGKIGAFHRSVQKHQDNLLNYFIFLRVKSAANRQST